MLNLADDRRANTVLRLEPCADAFLSGPSAPMDVPDLRLRQLGGAVVFSANTMKARIHGMNRVAAVVGVFKVREPRVRLDAVDVVDASARRLWANEGGGHKVVDVANNPLVFQPQRDYRVSVRMDRHLLFSQRVRAPHAPVFRHFVRPEFRVNCNPFHRAIVPRELNGYKANKYDIKLAQAFEQFAA
jgi:hypothetical protein